MTLNPIIKELITTYWSQVILILGLFTYFINRHFQTRDKRFELKYSLFQHEKIKAINLFINSYIQLEFTFTQLPFYDVFGSKYSAKEVDELIFPAYNRFNSSYFSLIIFLTVKEQAHFEAIYNSMNSIQGLIGQLLFGTGSTPKEISEKIEKYSSKAYDTARDNKKILRMIGNAFQIDYSK